MARDFLELMALGRRCRDGESTPQDLLTIMSLTRSEQYFYDKGRAPVITDPSPTLKELLKSRYPEMYERYHNEKPAS
jgi:hypothetical protein